MVACMQECILFEEGSKGHSLQLVKGDGGGRPEGGRGPPHERVVNPAALDVLHRVVQRGEGGGAGCAGTAKRWGLDSGSMQPHAPPVMGPAWLTKSAAPCPPACRHQRGLLWRGAPKLQQHAGMHEGGAPVSTAFDGPLKSKEKDRRLANMDIVHPVCS